MASGDLDIKYSMPIFNPDHGGVYYPYAIPIGEPGYIDLDGGDTSTILGALHRPPITLECVSVDCVALADGQGLKAAAASTEPIVGIVHGTATLASSGAGSSICNITCDGAGTPGKRWPGSTTRFTIAPTEMVAAYLNTAASSATSANQDGGAAVVLWIQPLSTP